jgi:hypothetical protein
VADRPARAVRCPNILGDAARSARLPWHRSYSRPRQIDALANFGARKLLFSLIHHRAGIVHLMELVGIFLAGALVGYAIRAFISARRRARARKNR